MDRAMERQYVGTQCGKLGLQYHMDGQRFVFTLNGCSLNPAGHRFSGAIAWMEGFSSGHRHTVNPYRPRPIADFVLSQEPIVLGLHRWLNDAFQKWAHQVVGLGNGEYGDAVIHEAIRRFAKEHGAI